VAGVLAGALIVQLSPTVQVARLTAGFVAGCSFALWALGTWWIPLLIIFGFWRHVRQRWPLAYETALWSVVFPLGMYSAATAAFGQAEQVTFMAQVARVMAWVAVIAWTAVAVDGLIAMARPRFQDLGRLPANPAGGRPA
jgi:tellurite resistance protein TehA-like permease